MLLKSVSGYKDPQIVESYQLRKSNSLNMLSFLSKAAWMPKLMHPSNIKKRAPKGYSESFAETTY